MTSCEIINNITIMTVKELKKLLRGADDNTEVEISVEGEVLSRDILQVYRWDNEEQCEDDAERIRRRKKERRSVRERRRRRIRRRSKRRR